MVLPWTGLKRVELILSLTFPRVLDLFYDKDFRYIELKLIIYLQTFVVKFELVFVFRPMYLLLILKITINKYTFKKDINK